MEAAGVRFSPRNGEVILKRLYKKATGELEQFQSPQWGSNSKAENFLLFLSKSKRFSPRNGEVILKDYIISYQARYHGFSPRNGEVILKGSYVSIKAVRKVSVPAMGK